MWICCFSELIILIAKLVFCIYLAYPCWSGNKSLDVFDSVICSTPCTLLLNTCLWWLNSEWNKDKLGLSPGLLVILLTFRSSSCQSTFPIFFLSGHFPVRLFSFQGIFLSVCGPVRLCTCEVVVLWDRLHVRVSSCEGVFLWGCLPAGCCLPVRLSSCEVVFLWGCLPLRLSCCEVVLLWGCLPVRSSTCEVFFLGGRLPLRSSSY